MVMDKPPYQDFRNEYGVVTNAHESGLVDISLCSGALLYQVSGESLKVAQLTCDEPECDQLASMCSKALQPDSEVKGPLPRSDAKERTFTLRAHTQLVSQLLERSGRHREAGVSCGSTAADFRLPRCRQWNTPAHLGAQRKVGEQWGISPFHASL